jgi:hypothetical protein
MKKPSVTVVIATYRAGEYLRAAILSALGQTHDDLEILVSDDAADPAVNELALSFGDERVRYRSNAQRSGPAGNHWAAIADARGRYVAILNHDDLWRPDWLATGVSALDSHPDAVVAFCDHDVVDADGRSVPGEAERLHAIWGRQELAPGLYRPFQQLVVRQSIPVAMGSMFRREAIDPRLLPDVGPSYDLWLAYALCRTGLGAYYIKETHTAWRTHPTQITGRRDIDAARGSVACWEAMSLDWFFRPVARSVRKKLADSAYRLAVAYLLAGEHPEARSAARNAIGAAPAGLKAWGVFGLGLLPRRTAIRVAAGRRG